MNGVPFEAFVMQKLCLNLRSVVGTWIIVYNIEDQPFKTLKLIVHFSLQAGDDNRKCKFSTGDLHRS